MISRMAKTVVIVGAGHAAGQAVVTLRQKKYAGKIILIGAEEYYPYQRPPLSKKFLAGELAADRLFVRPPSFYDQPNIELHLGTTVTRIDLAGKAVIDADQNSYHYENLIIATGARVRKLDVPGSGMASVYYLRDINDVTAMHQHMHEGKRLVIIGAGYIGLEVAAVASSKGLVVTVIEMADRVMSRVVSAQVSTFYESEHREHGVNLMLATGLAGFSGSDTVEQVDLTDGTSVAADFVLIGISLDTDERSLRRFIKDQKIEWPQVFGPKSGAEKASRDYGAFAIPATFLIGPDGKIKATNLHGPSMKDRIAKLFGK